MDDWLGKLIHAIRLANDLVEKAEKIPYDASYFLYDDHERLRKAKDGFIESLAKEIRDHERQRVDG